MPLEKCNHYDFSVRLGEDINETFTKTDDNGDAVSIDGSTLDINFKENIEDASAVLSAATGGPSTNLITILESGGANIGQYKVFIAGSLTTALDHEQIHVHDLLETNSSAEKEFLLFGNLFVSQAVT